MRTADCGFDDRPGYSGQQMLARFGPTLWIEVGFDSDFRPGVGVRPNLPPNQVCAPVDTGVIESCIDSALAITSNLPIVDRQHVAGVHGSSEVNMHLAQIRVPTLDVTVYGRFAGVHLHAGGQLHSALVGRTFLQNSTMVHMGRTGAVTLSRASSHD